MPNINDVIRVSENIVIREIQGEMLLVPITGGIGDSEDKMFTANECAREILSHTNGEKTVGEIIDKICMEYNPAQHELIKKDVIGFISELLEIGVLEIVK